MKIENEEGKGTEHYTDTEAIMGMAMTNADYLVSMDDIIEENEEEE